MVKIAPSILSADFTILKHQIEIVEKAGADWIHLDVMDGHFVPNITFGPVVVEAVNRMTDLPLDVHLMIEEPDKYIPQFRQAGADVITVHVEAAYHLHRVIYMIKEQGAMAGVSLNPATPVSSIENVMEDVDLILVMTVNPGFGGQSFIHNVLPKIEKITEMARAHRRELFIEVDGGVGRETAARVVQAGANVLVAGSAIFGATDIGGALKAIRESVEGLSR